MIKTLDIVLALGELKQFHVQDAYWLGVIVNSLSKGFLHDSIRATELLEKMIEYGISFRNELIAELQQNGQIQ